MSQKTLLAVTLLFSVFCIACFAFFYGHVFLYASTLAKNIWPVHPILAFFFIPLLFLLNAYIVKQYAPYLLGCGSVYLLLVLDKLKNKTIDESALNEYVGLKVLFVIMVGSVISTLGGGALGREGALVQMGGIIFLLIAQKLKKRILCLDLKDWMIVGGTTGFALVFNAPLAGFIFALEKFFHWHFKSSLTDNLKIFFRLGMLILIGILFSRWCLHTELSFNLPPLSFDWNLKIVAVLLLVSFLSALIAWSLQKILDVLSKWHFTLREKNIWYFLPILAGLLIASVNGLSKHYNFGSGGLDVEAAFSASHAVLTFHDLLSRILAIIASVMGASMGGTIFPSLTIGAHLGSLSSYLMPAIDAKLFICAGTAAFLGCFLRIPVTAIFLIVEITQRWEILIPVLFTTLIAYFLVSQDF
jgi:CIC family chloride channel protein